MEHRQILSCRLLYASHWDASLLPNTHLLNVVATVSHRNCIDRANGPRLIVARSSGSKVIVSEASRIGRIGHRG